MPSQGGGIPEDSLDQVFQYGYTTVDAGNLSAQVLPVRHLYSPVQGQRLLDWSEDACQSALHSAGDMQLTRSLRIVEGSFRACDLVAPRPFLKGPCHAEPEAYSD